MVLTSENAEPYFNELFDHVDYQKASSNNIFVQFFLRLLGKMEYFQYNVDDLLPKDYNHFYDSILNGNFTRGTYDKILNCMMKDIYTDLTHSDYQVSSRNEIYEIPNYPCKFTFFWPYRDEIRKHFTIKDSLKSQSKELIQEVRLISIQELL